MTTNVFIMPHRIALRVEGLPVEAQKKLLVRVRTPLCMRTAAQWTFKKASEP